MYFHTYRHSVWLAGFKTITVYRYAGLIAVSELNHSHHKYRATYHMDVHMYVHSLVCCMLGTFCCIFACVRMAVCTYKLMYNHANILTLYSIYIILSYIHANVWQFRKSLIGFLFC